METNVVKHGASALWPGATLNKMAEELLGSASAHWARLGLAALCVVAAACNINETATAPEPVVEFKGLRWMGVASSDRLSHTEALAFCEDLSYGGYSDWRLPTRDELMPLVEGCYNDYGMCIAETKGCLTCGFWDGPAADGCYWDDSLWEGPCFGYWTSTEVVTKYHLDEPQAFVVVFNAGATFPSEPGVGAYHARCVREDVAPMNKYSPNGVVVAFDARPTSALSAVAWLPGQGIVGLLGPKDSAGIPTGLDGVTFLDSHGRGIELQLDDKGLPTNLQYSNGVTVEMLELRSHDVDLRINVPGAEPMTLQGVQVPAEIVEKLQVLRSTLWLQKSDGAASWTKWLDYGSLAVSAFGCGMSIGAAVASGGIAIPLAMLSCGGTISTALDVGFGIELAGLVGFEIGGLECVAKLGKSLSCVSMALELISTGIDWGSCVPNCNSAMCGDNGCGGDCGSCPEDDVCENRQCSVCVPDCSSVECGPDPECKQYCGGCKEGYNCSSGKCIDASCEVTTDCAFEPYCFNGVVACKDNCGNGTVLDECKNGTCVDGECIGGCTPDCSGNECGPDGCGGSCGSCGSNEECENGLCKGQGGSPGECGDWCPDFPFDSWDGTCMEHCDYYGWKMSCIIEAKCVCTQC